MITAEVVREQFEYNPLTGLLYRAGKVAGYIQSRGYRVISVCGIKTQAHRLIWLWLYGEWPTEDIDHINRVKDDNRPWNLQHISHKLNTQRRQGGVSFHRRSNKWRAYVHRDGEHIHLGLFETKEEALEARRKYETDTVSKQAM